VVDDGGESLNIAVEANDRSYRVSRNLLDAPWIVYHDQNYAEAIQNLISAVYPNLTYNLAPTEHVAPGMTLQSNTDPWATCRKWAASIGMRLYFDVNGVVTMQPVPDPLTVAPCWTYKDDDESMLLYVTKTMDTEHFANKIIIAGEPACGCPPVRAMESDDEPTSPTRTEGPFGTVPKVIKSTFVHTTPQAVAMAKAELRKALKIEEDVRTITIPNPAHEDGDVVGIQRDRAKVNAFYVMNKIVIPMEAEQPLNVTMRTRHAA
jgi:hypothetical protein